MITFGWPFIYQANSLVNDLISSPIFESTFSQHPNATGFTSLPYPSDTGTYPQKKPPPFERRNIPFFGLRSIGVEFCFGDAYFSDIQNKIAEQVKA